MHPTQNLSQPRLQEDFSWTAADTILTPPAPRASMGTQGVIASGGIAVKRESRDKTKC
jgi:hypothetical protein